MNIPFAPQSIDHWSGFAISLLILAELLWLVSVVAVAREKTDDPLDRIVWLMIVLSLNFIGTLLYFFFSGSLTSPKAKTLVNDREADLKRRANEGTL